MGSYSQDEIFSATEVVRNFSSVLSSIGKGEKKRAVIVKNSKFEAVILSMKEYERMQEAVHILEKIYEQNKRKGKI